MPTAMISSIRAEHLQQGHTLLIGTKRVTINAIMWEDTTKTVQLFIGRRTFRLFYDTPSTSLRRLPALSHLPDKRKTHEA